jgi:hypothetical protein
MELFDEIGRLEQARPLRINFPMEAHAHFQEHDDMGWIGHTFVFKP